MNSEGTQKILLQFAYKLLARRPHAINEMRQKLKRKKIGTADDVEGVVYHLIDRKYLDDYDFAGVFIDEMLRRKPQGLSLITFNLRKKGVPKNIISDVVRVKNIDEMALAELAIKKKNRTLSSSHQQKEKLFRFLVSRGFTREAIYKALKFLETV